MKSTGNEFWQSAARKDKGHSNLKNVANTQELELWPVKELRQQPNCWVRIEWKRLTDFSPARRENGKKTSWKPNSGLCVLLFKERQFTENESKNATQTY
jgi:hypothetical protein